MLFLVCFENYVITSMQAEVGVFFSLVVLRILDNTDTPPSHCTSVLKYGSFPLALFSFLLYKPQSTDEIKIGHTRSIYYPACEESTFNYSVDLFCIRSELLNRASWCKCSPVLSNEPSVDNLYPLL